MQKFSKMKNVCVWGVFQGWELFGVVMQNWKKFSKMKKCVCGGVPRVGTFGVVWSMKKSSKTSRKNQRGKKNFWQQKTGQRRRAEESLFYGREIRELVLGWLIFEREVWDRQRKWGVHAVRHKNEYWRQQRQGRGNFWHLPRSYPVFHGGRVWPSIDQSPLPHSS